MVTKLRIYFEGDDGLRPGFDLIATDGTPVEDFRDALKTHSDAWNVLLLDSEDPQEFRLRKQGLQDCDQDSVFWMVQTMESWFLADLDALKAVFKGLNEAVVRGNPNVEEIPKGDLRERLDKAASGEYHKVKHGVKLLALIDPAKVRKAAPNCDRMFRLILARLG
jgi:Domain of unknown function (DUF4276)